MILLPSSALIIEKTLFNEGSNSLEEPGPSLDHILCPNQQETEKSSLSTNCVLLQYLHCTSS